MTDPLAALGFSGWFRNQTYLLAEGGHPARVFAVHRSGLDVRGENFEVSVPLAGRWYQADAVDRPTVGDWVLLDSARETVIALYERTSLLKRMHPGRPNEVQLIAANVDVLFVVTSCNEDFNASRLERYLLLAEEAGVQPVVVLTKADLTHSVDEFVSQIGRLGSHIPVEAVNATDAATLGGVRTWCEAATTVALTGSSGVGKSTLLNALAGDDLQRTGGIREDDGKGRHTTTHRSLHLLPSGVLVVDSPGIRELALVDTESALGEMFADVEALALQCRFNDCSHQSEPGCAVEAAIAEGRLDERRLASYRKLEREEVINSESVAERHARQRAFGKRVKSAAKAREDRKT